MATLDRLGWAAGTTFRSYGQRIGVRVSQRSLIPLVERVIGPFREDSMVPRINRLYSVIQGGEGPRRGVRRLHLVYAGGARIARARDLEDALRALESDIQLHVAERSRRFVFVHSGVVGWRGRAILIPGRSHSGKSTLVAALLEQGATYYSDEYALVDVRGRIHSYPVPLGLREKEGGLPKRRGPAIAEVPRPIRPGLVVVTEFEKGGRWRHRTLSPGQASLEILRHTVPARRDPARVLERLGLIAGEATVVKGVRGEARDAARRVLRLAEQ
jgi:hypothetical protein